MTDFSYAKNLYKAAEEFGVVYVLSLFGSNLKVRIPINDDLWNASIDEMHLSVRARNGLMRASADTIGKVSERIMEEGGLNKIRNLGNKSISEIKTVLLAEGYERLSEKEKIRFWQDFLTKNDISLT